MKRITLAIVLLATLSLQAQILNVNNSDGTYLPVETCNTKDITFNKSQKVVTLSLNEGIKHSFNTKNVTSISPRTDNSSLLTYNLNPEVVFDDNDIKSFTEKTEVIPTEETETNDYGDFVEKYAVNKIINITFSEKDVTVSGDIPYEKNGAHLTINSEASKVRYILKGKSSNGSLKIYSLKKFQLKLSGVDLTNPIGPAINVQTGKTIYFTIDPSTINNLCDGDVYNASNEDQKGTIFSEGQLIFDGTGTLNVTSHGGHGICSDDYIRIRSGNINIIKAAKDGFHTNDKFVVGRTAEASPTITVNAANNGIDCGKGEVVIDAGIIQLTTGGEAIKVEYEEENPDPLVTPNATINGGYIKLMTTDSKSSAIKTTGTYKQTGGTIHGTVYGDGSKVLNCDSDITFTGGKLVGFALGTVFADTTSAGGIKSEGKLYFKGGTLAISCTGKGAKGINCATTNITGGEITVLSTAQNHKGNDGTRKSIAIDTGNLTITNGNTTLKAYDNAISASKITLVKGALHAISDDDIAIDAEEINQSGGWIMSKDNE